MKQSPNLRPADVPRIRYRVRFAKVGLLRWISHRDLAQLWERLTRRAALPLSMTEGFHPKPRIAFPSALALGIESHDEVVEIELNEALEESALGQRLIADGQPGLFIGEVTRLAGGTAKAQLESADYAVTVPADLDGAETARVAGAIAALRQTETLTTERKKKNKSVLTHVPTQIPFLQLHRDALHLRLVSGDGASIKVTELLDRIAAGDWSARGGSILRRRVHLRGETPETFDPEAPSGAAPPTHTLPTPPSPRSGSPDAASSGNLLSNP